MAKNYLRALFFTGISSLLIGCATQKPITTQPKFEPHTFPAGQYTQKVDNFMVLFDASGTMRDSYKGKTKFHIARQVVSRMNHTIPADLRLTAALRAIGHAFGNDTTLLYGPTDYTKAGLEGALKNVSSGGWTPLNRGITAASEDLKSTKGDIAVFVVSDGLETEGGAVSAAKSMKSSYGDRVCIYTVLIGNNPAGKDLMEQIARASGCGFSVNAEDILSSKDMGDFVAKTFLLTAVDSDGDGVADSMDRCPDTPRGVAVDTKGCPMDSDGDGVSDSMDQCPGTPKGTTVDKKGCPLDSDGDGVYDYLDQCPNTPKGVKVDKRGCPLDTDADGVFDYKDQCPGTPKGATVNQVGCWILTGVLFDTAKWDIKPQAYTKLNEVTTILKKNPSMKLEIQGHTDNRGSAAYNKRLSGNRSKAVMEYLVRSGIDQNRLTAVGFGFSRPAASNATPEGRALNRRVELRPIQ